MEIVSGLFFVIIAASIGGVLAKLLKLPILVGYIVIGIITGALLPPNLKQVSSLAEIGVILLLFSIGIELSFDRLSKYLKIAVFGAIIQIVLTTILLYFILSLFNLGNAVSLVLALGFSVSSTAVVVKILGDRGELDSIHGGIIFGWLLVQDLAVIPIMVILPLLSGSSENLAGNTIFSFLKAGLVISVVILLGKKIVPYVIHLLAGTNSREVLLLTSIALALGTAAATSFFGISPALGAFLAGVVISESQENHAIFAETRPLRDLFVALFFVTMGFLVSPSVIISNLGLIVILALIVLLLKTIVVFFISYLFGYRGKTAVANSFGLAQVGEFAFVIFSAALALKILTAGADFNRNCGYFLTLVISPILYNFTLPFWRKMRSLTSNVPFLQKIFSAGEKHDLGEQIWKDHIIICGYGRVGKWIGKAFNIFEIPFVVVEYNQDVVSELN